MYSWFSVIRVEGGIAIGLLATFFYLVMYKVNKYFLYQMFEAKLPINFVSRHILVTFFDKDVKSLSTAIDYQT